MVDEGPVDTAEDEHGGDSDAEHALDDVDADDLSDITDDTISDVDPDAPEDGEVEVPEMDDPLVHGDVDEGVDAALSQSESGLCVPASAAMVVTLVTGEETTEQEAMEAAQSLGLLDGEPGNWEGMSTDEAVSLLEHMGVDARVETGDLDALRDHLDAGDAVIVSVDSEELWGEGEGGADPDHAVVVLAIDDERGVAIVNDPGVPGGQGVEVPLSVLEDAWEDSGNEMVVGDDDPVDSGAGGPFGDVLSPRAGFVLLPLALGGSILTARRRQYPLFSKENVNGSNHPPR
ncbi:MAG: C39 family peptidase [Acidimicrobiia bacterium]|nr:C39 family peptidase [Acidimicrobiia bacterium]